ncbi:MAG: hypothetical protein EA351_03020 [Gemmatimonadales bacterium]|nr:MAG: hypothetical protein EA351_03020 [Gemmatimonadales bacterium]
MRLLVQLSLGLALAAVATVSVRATPVTAQVERGAVEGQIVDEDSGRGIPVVRVEILDLEGRILASTSTDSEGRFRVDELAEGPIRLRAERIGYTSATREERIVGGETLVLTLRLPSEVLTLAPFEIGARARARPAEFEGFQERASRGVGGTHITRREIDVRSPGRLSDLLVGVPGLRITESPSLGRSNRRVSLAWSLPGQAGGRCPMQVFVNGVPARDPGRLDGVGGMGATDGVTIDHLVHPSALEGIEIYTDLASVPAEFLTPDAGCGVIALWTRLQSR